MLFTLASRVFAVTRESAKGELSVAGVFNNIYDAECFIEECNKVSHTSNLKIHTTSFRKSAGTMLREAYRDPRNISRTVEMVREHVAKIKYEDRKLIASDITMDELADQIKENSK